MSEIAHHEISLLTCHLGRRVATLPFDSCTSAIATRLCVRACVCVRTRSCPSFLSNWNVLSGKLAGGACVILWAAVKWRIDAFSVPFHLSVCVCVHPPLGVCVLVLSVAGYLEVISHTGAANNTRHEMEHSLLLTQRSTFINKVYPLSIAGLSVGKRRQHIGHGTASVVCVLLRWQLVPWGTWDIGVLRCSDGTRQCLIRLQSLLYTTSVLCCRKTGALLCTVMVKLPKGEFHPRAPRMHEPTLLSFQRADTWLSGLTPTLSLPLCKRYIWSALYL